MDGLSVFLVIWTIGAIRCGCLVVVAADYVGNDALVESTAQHRQSIDSGTGCAHILMQNLCDNWFGWRLNADKGNYTYGLVAPLPKRQIAVLVLLCSTRLQTVHTVLVYSTHSLYSVVLYSVSRGPYLQYRGEHRLYYSQSNAIQCNPLLKPSV